MFNFCYVDWCLRDLAILCNCICISYYLNNTLSGGTNKRNVSYIPYNSSLFYLHIIPLPNSNFIPLNRDTSSSKYHLHRFTKFWTYTITWYHC